MSADKVQEARRAVLLHDLPMVEFMQLVADTDALIAAVREDEKQKCIAAVMSRRPDIAYDRDDDHINQGISLAVEAIRNA